MARPDGRAIAAYPAVLLCLRTSRRTGTGQPSPPAEQAHRSLELFDTVITSIFDVGLNLQVAMDLPADAAREHIAAAVVSLDETIREVRDTAFTARDHETAPRTSP